MQPSEIFELLVREHAGTLSIYLETLSGDRDVADDLFQETLLVAWKRLDAYDRKRPFGQWLRGIARTLALAHFREQGRRGFVTSNEVLASLEERCHSLQSQGGDTLNQKMEILDECIEALPHNYRQAIRLRYVDDVRGARLAEFLETSGENAKKLLQRGRELLASCFLKRLRVEGYVHGNRQGS